MTKNVTREMRERNPYHVWVHRGDGSKFVGHFKDRADAIDFSRRLSKQQGRQKIRVDYNKTTTASQQRPKRSVVRRSVRRSPFGLW